MLTDVGHINLIGGLVTCNPSKKHIITKLKQPRGHIVQNFALLVGRHIR